MKKHLLFCLLVSLTRVTSAQDLEGSKDPELFPTRMPNYIISEQVKNFDAVEFLMASETTKTLEGNKILTRYDFNTESGQQKPSCLQIIRNYEAAIKRIGGTTIFMNAPNGTATFKLAKNGKETWVKIEAGGSDNNDFYYLTVLDIEAMKQDVTSNDMLSALNASGHIALYINFDTGKSDIKPESQTIIDQIAELLKTNPTLKISIEGHTDNVGTAAANKTLSENRAKAVMNAVAAKGIDKSRMTSKGWGQEKPVGDNATEDGKASNRRVEIVKT